jgi:NTE family protein
MPDLAGRRVGVSLSSGFFGFFAHAGFLAALDELGVRPAAVTGCSAGALTGALHAAGLDAGDVLDVLCAVRIRDFADPPHPRDLLARPFGLLGGRKLARSLRRILPVSTFDQCAVPFALTVFDLESRERRVIDRGPLAPALRASLSLPGMFQPAVLGTHPCWDAGVVEKVPLSFLVERSDIDTIVICYLPASPDPRAPRSLFSGLRRTQMTLVGPADRRAVEEARAAGREVIVVAPAVPRCGPHRLRMGRDIADLSRRDVLRILERGDTGHPELG